MQGVRLLHSAQSPLQCEAGLSQPGSCSLIPHLLGSYIFLFVFKWQVFYPTINKIKYILYIGKQIEQHFYKKNRLEEHGTVDACMTSLTESAQG